MKTVTAMILLVLVIINIGTAWFVIQQMGDMKKEVQLLRAIPVELPPAFKEKFEHDVNAIVSRITDSTSHTMSLITPKVEELIASAYTNTMNLCRTKVLGNEIEAEKSYSWAEQALADDDISLAKIYCMNAINHSPTRKKYFQQLLKVYDKGNCTAKEDLEQLKNAFELGIYQVAADDVIVLRDMLAATLDKISQMDASEVAARENEAELLRRQTIAELKDGALSLNALQTNSVALVNGLRDRLTTIGGIEKGSLPSNEVTWIEGQEEKTRVFLDYYGLYASIDTGLTHAKKLLDEGDGKLGSVNIMVQAACQSLSQALGLDVSLLPDGASDQLQNFARRIEEIERNFNLVKSKPAIANVEQYIASADQIKLEAPYQEKIDELDRLLASISQELPRVFVDEKRNEYESKMKSIAVKLAECKQWQYRAYQSWAIEHCDAGLKKYKSWHRVDIPDAKEVIYGYLIEIDSTLLTPDVSRLYQDVLGKQFAELKGETANMEIEMARALKKSLKDF